MYGQGFEEGGPAEQWAASKGLKQNIYFRGAIPNQKLQIELRTMSVLLHPALEESFGMVIGEAVALGLPVVAGNDSGAVRWVLDEGRAGFLTDMRRPESIADTLLACVRQVDLREQRRRYAYERIVKKFSPASVALQYEGIYKKILVGSSR